MAIDINIALLHSTPPHRHASASHDTRAEEADMLAKSSLAEHTPLQCQRVSLATARDYSGR